jgi:hypothetical protein
MWIITTTGFFSVVRADRRRMQIRARARQDLTKLKRRFKIETDIIFTPHADYPVRIIVTRAQWKHCMAGFARDPGRYTNFKKAVSDPVRADIYLDVWDQLREIEHY